MYNMVPLSKQWSTLKVENLYMYMLSNKDEIEKYLYNSDFYYLFPLKSLWLIQRCDQESGTLV